MSGRKVGSIAEKAPEKEIIRIVTFNVKCGTSEDGPNHWDFRRPLFLETIGELAPDVLGVQESYPFQSDEIGMRFPYFGRKGVGRYQGVADPGRPMESRSGEHCDIFYDVRKLCCDHCGTFWHSAAPDAPAGRTWGNELPRLTTWAVLRSLSSGRSFVFFNTHFHWGEPYRGRTVELHLERVPRCAAGLPVVFAGDFNLPPGSEAHRRFTAPAPDGLGLRDVWRALGRSEEGAGSCHDWDGKPKERIDWILAGPGLDPVSVELSHRNDGGRYPSDHFPLVAELELRGGASRG